MTFPQDKRNFGYSFAGCLLALVVWALSGWVWSEVQDWRERQAVKELAISRCIDDNTEPRRYGDYVREYCENTWQLYVQ